MNDQNEVKTARQLSNAKWNPINNIRNNPLRMFVNGQYVSKTHPMWKAGNYKTFTDAAFSNFPNYSKDTRGDVYLITNEAWPEWVKVGKAVEAKDRLKSYQTSDPFRSYKLNHSVAVPNRHTAEIKAHKALEILSNARRNEWFKIKLNSAVHCIEALSE